MLGVPAGAHGRAIFGRSRGITDPGSAHSGGSEVMDLIRRCHPGIPTTPAADDAEVLTQSTPQRRDTRRCTSGVCGASSELKFAKELIFLWENGLGTATTTCPVKSACTCQELCDAHMQTTLRTALMPHPTAIANTAGEDQEDLRGQRQEYLGEDISLVGPQGETIAVHPRESDDAIRPLIEAPPGPFQPLRLMSELTFIASATVPRLADPPMAPGIGGFNIELPRPKITRVLELGFENGLAPQSSMQRESTTTNVSIGAASFLANLLAVGGFMLFVFFGETHKLSTDIPTPTPPLHEGARINAITLPARLLIEHQKGIVNEPLPLGILLKDGAGEETVRVTGLVNGTELSLGSSVGLAGWTVSAGDVDKTFVGAPKDFVGIMEVMVDLHSASGQLMDSQVLRLEWVEKKHEGVGGGLISTSSTAVGQSARPGETVVVPPAPPLDPEQIAALIKLGQDLLKRGDIATARFLLKRAAIAGNAQAALELGMSFDPSFLGRLGVPGFAPDPAQAVQWYERAIELGSTEASDHLHHLKLLASLANEETGK